MLDADYNGDLSGHNWAREAGLIAQDILIIDEVNKFVIGGDIIDASGVVKQETYYLIKG